MKNKIIINKKTKAKSQARTQIRSGPKGAQAGRQTMRTAGITGTVNPKQLKTRKLPLTVKHGSVRNAMYNYGSYHAEGHEGIVMSGRSYLTDLTWNENHLVANQLYTRTQQSLYLNPALVGGKLNRMAQNFQHYRFTKLRLVYAPAQPTTVMGEVMFGFTRNIAEDPSTLTDKELRQWYDGLEGSYLGPVAALDMENPSADYRVLNPSILWYDTASNTDDIMEAFQGKIYLAVTAMGDSFGTVPFLGEFSLEWEVILSDTQERTTNDGPVGVIKVLGPVDTICTPGSDLKFKNDTAPEMCPGVHQVMCTTDKWHRTDNVNMNTSKIARIGVEFIGVIIGVPGLATSILYLYDTWADFEAGQKACYAGSVNQVWNGITGNIQVRARALLYDDINYDPSVGVPYSVSKGLKIGRHPTFRALMKDYCDENPGYAIRGNSLIFTGTTSAPPPSAPVNVDIPSPLRVDIQNINRRLDELRLESSAGTPINRGGSPY